MNGYSPNSGRYTPSIETVFSHAARFPGVSSGSPPAAVVAVASERHHGLMEHMADRIATAVLRDARVAAVDVTLRKLRPRADADE